MDRKYDVSESVVTSIVEALDFDSIEDAEEQLNAMSELGVLYQEEFDAILKQLKEKEKTDISDDEEEYVTRDEQRGLEDASNDEVNDKLIKDVEDYPLEAKSKIGQNIPGLFFCDICEEFVDDADFGKFMMEYEVVDGGKDKVVKVCRECLKRKGIAFKKKTSEIFTCNDCKKEFFIENLGIYAPENVLMGGDSTERIELCKECLHEYVSKTSAKSASSIFSKLELGDISIVRKKEGYYLRYAENEIGPFKNAALNKIAVVQNCKEKDKDTADDVWCVYAESGRCMGRYKTKGEAEERLAQVKMFKHIKGK